ncbi:MAG: acyltransferase [Chloroflexi bacterium]|nr:acyltransferase [Chloroflexota bacterium]
MKHNPNSIFAVNIRHIKNIIDTPWKAWNELDRWLIYPKVRLLFTMNGIQWGHGWRIYGMPIIQKHRQSQMRFGTGLQLRSSVRSNPLCPTHPVALTTWKENALLEIGTNFSMTGGVLCSAERISIGDDVAIGANTTIIDTDFHPLDPLQRKYDSAEAISAPVIIGDEIFIGMHCLILKGVAIGRGSVIGAGSVVTRNIPSYSIAVGNPAKVIRQITRSVREHRDSE